MRKFINFFWFIILVLSGLGCEVSRPPDDVISQIPPSISATPMSFRNDAIIKIHPKVSTLKVGDTFTLEVLVENVPALVGIDIELQFDPTVLQAQDTDLNIEGIQVQPGEFLFPDFQMTNTVDNVAGLVQYTVIQDLASSEPVSGSGVIVLITFLAITDGRSELTFIQTDLASRNAQPIDTTSVRGQVVVDK